MKKGNYRVLIYLYLIKKEECIEKLVPQKED